MPWPLYLQGKSPWYPLERRLGGPQSQPGLGEEKNSQPLPRLKSPMIQPIAQHYYIFHIMTTDTGYPHLKVVRYDLKILLHCHFYNF
jgi:hypothetical protein